MQWVTNGFVLLMIPHFAAEVAEGARRTRRFSSQIA